MCVGWYAVGSIQGLDAIGRLKQGITVLSMYSQFTMSVYHGISPEPATVPHPNAMYKGDSHHRHKLGLLFSVREASLLGSPQPLVAGNLCEPILCPSSIEYIRTHAAAPFPSRAIVADLCPTAPKERAGLFT